MINIVFSVRFSDVGDLRRYFLYKGRLIFLILQLLLNNNEEAEILTVPFKVQLVEVLSFNYILSFISFPFSVQMTENVDMALLTLA